MGSIDSNGFTIPTIPTLYKYEPFFYSVVFPTQGGYVAYGDASLNYTNGTLRNNSLLLNSLSFVSSNRVDLSSAGVAFTTATAGEQFLVQAQNPSSDILASTPITVKVGNGRFTVPQGLNYILYANETANVILNTAAPMTSVNSTPALPVGLSFTKQDINGSVWAITGRAVTTYQQSSYLVIGNNSSNGYVVTTTLLIRVNPTRMYLAGVPTLISGLTVGTPIPPYTITAGGANIVVPGTMTYQVPALPSGLYCTDLSGTTLQPGTAFQPVDASMSLIITGTPTSSSAVASIPSGQTKTTVYATAGTLSTSNIINFSYGEAVLFTNPSNNAALPGLFYSIPTSNNVFNASTYFGSSAIQTIYSPNLRSDLSLNFSSTTKSATLVGTPTLTGLDTTPYTVVAVNAHAIRGSVVVTIPIATDTITITRSVTDTCFNFVVGRPVSSALTGYYPSNIAYTATSASGRSLTFSSNNFPPGVSLSQTGNTLTVVGTPTKVTSTANLNVSASDGYVSATDSAVAVSVVTDQFTWSYLPSQSTYYLLQNQSMPVIKTTASSLSGLSILSYYSSDLPAGLKITDTGLISGTPSSNGTLTSHVYASTGYVANSSNVQFNVAADSALFTFPTIVTTGGATIPPTQITCISYSEIAGSNFSISNNPYGVTVDSNGVLGGTMITGNPPGTAFLPSATLTVSANIGNATQSSTINMTASNILVSRTFALTSSGLSIYDSTIPPSSNVSFSPLASVQGGVITDLQSYGSTVVDSNVILATTGSAVYKSTDGLKFTSNAITQTVTSLTYLASESLWYGAGVSGGNFLVSTSPNGTNWTFLINLGSFSGTPIIRAFNGRVLTNYNGVTMYPNPVTGSGWYNSLRISGRVLDLATDSNATPTWIASVNDGTIWVSQVNGNVWIQSTTDNAYAFTSTQSVYTNNKWYNIYGSSQSGTIYSVQKSVDGFAWTTVGNTSRATPFFMYYDGNQYLISPLNTNPTLTYKTLDTFTDAGFVTSSSQPLVTINSIIAPIFIRPNTGLSVITLSAFTGSGPTFTSPTGVNIFAYQYVAITPIYISTTSPSTDRIYIQQSALPLGLSFDTATSTISGSMMRLGPFQVTVYAGNSTGTSTLTLYFTCQLPFVLNKNQDYASAYTSYLRQEVIINGAISGRDSTAYPSLTTTVGALMGPQPLDVVSAPKPCCK